ncbi:dihydroxyacetone kinase subunit DhaL [Demetria terragena]|uniref:dihydroxyacetone kinase subunit DhaL n=1 Tax=Demetria terragena TaxID=63959 RepID=UPI00037DF57E|nr:dihydroxyacetone kinase subunit DhaL [Demetria terragena]
MTDCSTEGITRAVVALHDTIQAHHEELTTLDRAIGDGDHGANLVRGFAAVAERLSEGEQPTPGAALKVVATTLISTVGGASGPLFGTAFLRAATSLGTAETVTARQIADALEAAAAGVVARGKAELGDKTMIDAFQPALEAARDAAGSGADIAGVLDAAATAAEQGAAATAPLQARKGRASYLGERSVGHVDPGAQSTAYLLRSLATSAAS